MAVSRGIPFWRLQETEKGVWQAETSIEGVKPVFRLARQNRCRVKIIAKKGPAFLLSRMKRRRSFILGGLLFILALFCISRFIWVVEVRCNDPQLNLAAREIAGAYGLTPGSLKSAVHQDEVRSGIYRALPDISWVGIELEGSRLILTLADKRNQMEPSMVGRGDLIAAEDGVIAEILVLQGTAMVKPGETVRKGQVLVAGYRPFTQAEWAAAWQNRQKEEARRQKAGLGPKENSPEEEEAAQAADKGLRLLPARAVVRARVRREILGESVLRQEIRKDTGEETTWYQLRVADKVWRLSGLAQPPYGIYRQVVNVKTLWQDKDKAREIQLVSVTHKEQRLLIQERSLQQAAAESHRLAQAELLRQTPADCRILREEIRPGQELAGKVQIIWRVETLEDIGEYVRRD
jgi:similar to stage IV sporulation protein